MSFCFRKPVGIAARESAGIQLHIDRRADLAPKEKKLFSRHARPTVLGKSVFRRSLEDRILHLMDQKLCSETTQAAMILAAALGARPLVAKLKCQLTSSSSRALEMCGIAVLWRFPRAVGRVGAGQFHRPASMLSIRGSFPPPLASVLKTLVSRRPYVLFSYSRSSRC